MRSSVRCVTRVVGIVSAKCTFHSGGGGAWNPRAPTLGKLGGSIRTHLLSTGRGEKCGFSFWGSPSDKGQPHRFHNLRWEGSSPWESGTSRRGGGMLFPLRNLGRLHGGGGMRHGLCRRMTGVGWVVVAGAPMRACDRVGTPGRLWRPPVPAVLLLQQRRPPAA